MPRTSVTLRIVNALSFIGFAVLVGFAASSLHTVYSNRLPIPVVDQVLGLGLPLLQLATTILVACRCGLARFFRPQSASDRRQRLGSIANAVLWVLSILDTILWSTSVFARDPQTLICNLDTTWLKWFMSKDAGSIRAIQDNLECCGLHSSVDMAWPFPEEHVNQHACEERFGRVNGCLTPWEVSTHNVLFTFTAIGAFSFTLKLLLVLLCSFLQIDDLNFGFNTRTSQNDAERRPLLDQEDRSNLPPIHEGDESQNTFFLDAER